MNRSPHSATERSIQPAGQPIGDQPSQFAAMGLHKSLVDALARAGYATPTPIQRQSIPHALAGRDVLGCAQTGTGKTAAFSLPILHGLLQRGASGGHIQALILAPTRELASQIGESLRLYAGRDGPRFQVVFGGVCKRTQAMKLRRGTDILVATPGRLIDLMNTRDVDLSRVSTFVLDEADRMLDMGFINDVRRIVKVIPTKRQTLFFSATMPQAIAELARQLLQNPVAVSVDPISSTGKPIIQSVYLVERPRKLALLQHLLLHSNAKKSLVFTRTKHGANRVVADLARVSIQAAAIHGNKSQSVREKTLRAFRDGVLNVVVATDIAARGIDIKDISHVINFELPNDPETYVHRVGRTGRAGRSGEAISLCASDERSCLRSIERLTQQRLEHKQLPDDMPQVALSAPPEREQPPRARHNPGRSFGRRRGFSSARG